MKHGLTDTRLYGIFHNMKQRCYNPNNPKYNAYGGKGITICSEWLEDFEKFYNWALQNGYQEHLTIDRIENKKAYQPDNCRWITMEENRRAARRKGQKITDNPKDTTVRARTDAETVRKLDYLVSEQNYDRSKIIRQGIEIQYEQRCKK